MEVTDLEAQLATAKDVMVSAKERMDARLATKLEKELEMETVAKEHREASLRLEEHRAEKDKAAPKATADTDKCEQVWADLEHAAFKLEEAVKAGKSADIPALMALAVRKSKAECVQTVTALSKTAAEAATGKGSSATA